MNSKILILAGCAALLAARQVRAQTTITAWTFDNLPIGVNPSPSPSTGSGLASALGMSNSYNNTTSVSTPDVVSTSGSSSTGTSEPYAWRIRGQNPGNGWSSQAPIGTQGAEFDASTAGYSGIQIYFDVNTTAQAEANLQLEYTIDGTTWNNAAITYSGTQGTIKNNSTSLLTVDGTYIQFASSSWVNGISADLSGISGVNNDPTFGIRLVNASTGTDDINGSGGAYNNSSGNWRFDNVIITGVAVPEPGTGTILSCGLGILLHVLRRRQSRVG
jgi:hypothetical protein